MTAEKPRGSGGRGLYPLGVSDPTGTTTPKGSPGWVSKGSLDRFNSDLGLPPSRQKNRRSTHPQQQAVRYHIYRDLAERFPTSVVHCRFSADDSARLDRDI